MEAYVPRHLPLRIEFDKRFYYFTLSYSAALMALLPFFGCSHAFSCPARASTATVSVSSLVDREPLATSYAYLGALLLFSIVFCQSDHHISNGRFLLSLVAAKALAVPLIVPLGSGGDSTHDVMVIVGGSLEVLVNAAIWSERNTTRVVAEWWFLLLTGLMAVSLIVGSSIAYNPWAGHAYAVLAFEYVYGASLVSSAVIAHVNGF
jgi:hypothetical protein